MTHSSIENGSNVTEQQPQEGNQPEPEPTVEMFDSLTGEYTQVPQSQFEDTKNLTHVATFMVEGDDMNHSSGAKVVVEIRCSEQTSLQEVVEAFIYLSGPDQLLALWNGNTAPEAHLTIDDMRRNKLLMDVGRMLRDDPSLIDSLAAFMPDAEVQPMGPDDFIPDDYTPEDGVAPIGTLPGDPGYTPDEPTRRIADNQQA